MKLTHIKLIRENGIFHVIAPLSNIHLTTDELGAFIIDYLINNDNLDSLASAVIQRFNADAAAINSYLREFSGRGLLTLPQQTPFYHNDYIHSFASLPDGYSFHPNFLYWVISWDCNLRCKMCPLWSADAAGHTLKTMNKTMLSLEESKEIIANLAKSRLSVIHITGGEPLLYPHLIETVREIKRHGMKVSVFSNGTLMNKEYAQKLIETGIDKIGISLDGTEDIHDLIRGKGNFRRAKEGFINLLAARKKNGSACRIYIMNTITKYNYDKLSGLMELAAEIGIDGMFSAHPSFTSASSPERQKQILSQCFLPLLDGPSWNAGQSKVANETKEIPAKTLKAAIEELKNLARLYNLEFSSNLEMTIDELNKYYNLNDGKVIERCLWPWQGAFMDPAGKLYPCMKVDIGDLKKDDFSGQWNSDIYRRFRRLIKTKKTLPCCERCCQLIHEQSRIDAQLTENIIKNQTRKEVMQ